jgi:DNA-binding CsgD family transcriptional regulator
VTLVSTLAEGLAGEFRLQPLLDRILTSAVRLLECQSGSICTIDESSGTYRKEADLGVRCQAGRVFQLGEGVTGAVKRIGGYVTFDRYGDVPYGHVAPEDERFNSPVIGVPLSHHRSLIGAFVVFGTPGARSFKARDAETLARFATHASIAIVNSRLYSAALDDAIAAELGRRPSLTTKHPWHPGDAAGQAGLKRLTAREMQVLQLVIQGLPDKLIALDLGISAKTVEKHVGALLRKTGAFNRTMLAAQSANGMSWYGGNPE